MSLPNTGSRRRTLRPAELLPLSAVVVGSSSPRAPTILEAAVAAARPAASGSLRADRPLVRATGLIVIGEREVMRISVGAGRGQLHHQRSMLEVLHATKPSDSVADRAPWPVADGEAGVADWSLERRLPGTEPSPPLGNALVGECCDFLVALHQVYEGARRNKVRRCTRPATGASRGGRSCARPTSSPRLAIGSKRARYGALRTGWRAP